MRSDLPRPDPFGSDLTAPFRIAESAACRLEQSAAAAPTALLAGVADEAQVYFTHSYAAPVVAESRRHHDATA